VCVVSQGMVLSSFFWGYATTQVLGGYLSDRCGAKRVMMAAMLGWSLLTLMTPVVAQSCSDDDRPTIRDHSATGSSTRSAIVLRMFVIMRILTGCLQGSDGCIVVAKTF